VQGSVSTAARSADAGSLIFLPRGRRSIRRRFGAGFSALPGKRPVKAPAEEQLPLELLHPPGEVLVGRSGAADHFHKVNEGKGIGKMVSQRRGLLPELVEGGVRPHATPPVLAVVRVRLPP